MVKALSLNDIRRRCGRFVADWSSEPGEERQQAQSFVRDLLGAYGITKTKAALYEHRARRSSTGRHGYIDALVPGLCLIEMKSAGEDLDAAEGQALDYIDSLPDVEVPRWVVTSDFKNFRILDLHASAGEGMESFPLEDLVRNAESLAFLAGYQTRSFGDQEQETASIKAAQLMARLYEGLSEVGYSDHDASVFLVRVLFALYADDAGVWERDLFYEFIETRTNTDGSDLGPQLAMLFQIMNLTPEQRQRNIDELLQRFPYVNGGIFAEPARIPSFDHDMRELLLEACAFNWATISPAIFGSLFQAVKSPEARRELGEHYTTETNILKTIEPLFLDELRDEYRTALHDVRGLKKLRDKLRDLRVMDPACGCGNFLVIAYRELRQLDLDILTRLQDLGDTSQIPMLYFTKEDLPVTLDHFAGIEIEEWPARIAATALHLADHQANQAMELALGKAPDPLPLDQIETIHLGNALHMDWTEIFHPTPDVRIVGNPPFTGARIMTREQKADMVEVWGKEGTQLDYVTGWYKKASDYFDRVPRGGRFAFVSTNSIAQGQPVPALFRPLLDAGWRIRFAHQTFAWTSEAPGAAAVHCVIVGFDKKERKPPVLYAYEHLKGAPIAQPSANINAYLLDGADIFVESRSKPIAEQLPPLRFGSMPNDGGNLIVEREEYEDVLADPIASRYLRPFRMGKELIHGFPRWCLWLEDLDPSDLVNSEILRNRIRGVREHRLKSKRAATRGLAATPHLFAERRQPTLDYVGMPRIFSEERPFATVQPMSCNVIAADSVFTAEDPTGLLFGVISSSMFLAWQKAVGGRLKSDFRLSATIVWNNFPLPDLSDEARGQIIAAGKGVLQARAMHPDRSLADHYNPLAMDPALLRAHQALDRVVDHAFGARTLLTTDPERQELLFKKYAELSSL